MAFIAARSSAVIAHPTPQAHRPHRPVGPGQEGAVIAQVGGADRLGRPATEDFVAASAEGADRRLRRGPGVEEGAAAGLALHRLAEGRLDRLDAGMGRLVGRVGQVAGRRQGREGRNRRRDPRRDGPFRGEFDPAEDRPDGRAGRCWRRRGGRDGLQLGPVGVQCPLGQERDDRVGGPASKTTGYHRPARRRPNSSRAFFRWAYPSGTAAGSPSRIAASMASMSARARSIPYRSAARLRACARLQAALRRAGVKSAVITAGCLRSG
jgi:hypothetical protein